MKTAQSLKVGSPSADVALLVKVDGFASKDSSVLMLRGRTSTSSYYSSTFKDGGASLVIANSLASWREQNEGFSVESEGGGCGPLCLFSNKSLVFDFPKTHSNDAKCADPTTCS